MAGQLRQAGWSMTLDPAQATVIVVNTCSFVESAINESIDTILELSRFKKEGRCKRLVVAGCLPERFREAIADALPEVDQFLGTGAFSHIVDAVTGELARGTCLLPDPDRIPIDRTGARERVGLPHRLPENCRRLQPPLHLLHHSPAAGPPEKPDRWIRSLTKPAG
jgi:ribosomal protein S12 methylthiotransferase